MGDKWTKQDTGEMGSDDFFRVKWNAGVAARLGGSTGRGVARDGEIVVHEPMAWALRNRGFSNATER